MNWMINYFFSRPYVIATLMLVTSAVLIGVSYFPNPEKNELSTFTGTVTKATALWEDGTIKSYNLSLTSGESKPKIFDIEADRISKEKIQGLIDQQVTLHYGELWGMTDVMELTTGGAKLIDFEIVSQGNKTVQTRLFYLGFLFILLGFFSLYLGISGRAKRAAATAGT